jgi:hypothetical protein
MLAAADDAATEETIGAEGCPARHNGWLTIFGYIIVEYH